MEDLYETGKVKAIGVANWSVPYLEELSKTWKIIPAVNQVELHPFLPQHALRAYCEKFGILMEAYSPLGSTGKVSRIRYCRLNHKLTYLKGAPIMSDPEIRHLADKYQVSAATILISYHVCKGVVAIPKSVSEKRISDNKKVVEISSQDIAMLDSLAGKGKTQRINTPLWGFDLGFDDWYK